MTLRFCHSILNLACDQAHIGRARADRIARGVTQRWPPRKLFYASLQFGDPVTLSVNYRYCDTRKKVLSLSTNQTIPQVIASKGDNVPALGLSSSR